MLVTLLMIVIFTSCLCFQAAILNAARQGRDTERLLMHTLRQMTRFQPKGNSMIRFSFHKSAGF